jgi:uncharacterized membrane protein
LDWWEEEEAELRAELRDSQQEGAELTRQMEAATADHASALQRVELQLATASDGLAESREELGLALADVSETMGLAANTDLLLHACI